MKIYINFRSRMVVDLIFIGVQGGTRWDKVVLLFEIHDVGTTIFKWI